MQLTKQQEAKLEAFRKLNIEGHSIISLWLSKNEEFDGEVRFDEIRDYKDAFKMLLHIRNNGSRTYKMKEINDYQHYEYDSRTYYFEHSGGRWYIRII